MPDTSRGVLVAVPTHNGAARIPPLLRDLAGQTLDPSLMDVLVVDNGSVAGNAAAIEHSEAMRELASRYHAEVLSIEPPGLTNARIEAVRASRREIVLFLDDDTRPDRECCARALRSFDEPRVGVVFGRVYPEYATEPGHSIRKREGILAVNHRLGDADLTWKSPAEFAPTLGAALAVRTRAFLEAYPWREPHRLLPDRVGTRLVSGGDLEIGQFLARAGWWRIYNPAVIVQHALDPARLRTGPFCRLILSIERSRATFEEKFGFAPSAAARRARALAELGAILAFAPVWVFSRDGYRGWLFALASRAGRIAGAYPAARAFRSTV